MIRVEEITYELNRILCHEYQHFNFYMQCLFNVKNKDRMLLKDFLDKEMNSELGHIKIFADKIAYFNIRPWNWDEKPWEDAVLIKIDHFSYENILEKAIKLEQSILKIYHDAYKLAEKWGEQQNDMSISLMLEEQIEHSTKDMEEMVRLSACCHQ